MKDLTALLLALALCLPLSACSSPDPGTPAGESVPIPESSAASSEAELPQEENSSLPEEEPEIEEEPAADLLPEVEAMAYLFDVQVVLDSLTADLEQYSRLSADAENFPQRSAEIMEEMQGAFAEIAALSAPEGYMEVSDLAAEAAGDMEAVIPLVEEAFRLGRDTAEGSQALQEANSHFRTAVGWLEQNGAILAHPVEERLETAPSGDPEETD